MCLIDQIESGLFLVCGRSSLRVNLRSANLKAKDNMRKAAQQEVSLSASVMYHPSPFEVFFL